MTEVLRIALTVASAFEASGLRYLVGGSLASSFAGEPRSTLDIDFVVELPENRIVELAARLGDDFYFEAEDARRAVRAGSCVNAIHQPTGIKVDLFVAHSSLDARQLNRRRRIRVGARPEEQLFIYTPEDIVLQKLRWYRLGGESSDRQWRDIMGVLIAQGDHLDRAYLAHEAGLLGVTDLWERATGAAGGRSG